MTNMLGQVNVAFRLAHPKKCEHHRGNILKVTGIRPQDWDSVYFKIYSREVAHMA